MISSRRPASRARSPFSHPRNIVALCAVGLVLALLPATGASAAEPRAAKKATATSTAFPSATPTAVPSPTKSFTATAIPTHTATNVSSPTATTTGIVNPSPSTTASPSSTVTAVAPSATASATAAAVATQIGPTGSIGLGTYRPEFPNNLSSAIALEDASGKRLAIIHWYALWGGWKSAFRPTDLQLVHGRGSVPMITWEPWAATPNDPAWTLREAILSGKNDAYITSWAQGLASYGQPVLLRFAHEMHNHSYPWALGVNGNTAAEYVAAWKHVHAIFVRNGATNVKWVWNPNTMGATTAATYLPLYRSLYPGDEYVDWLGLDIYNTGPSLDWGAPYWRTFPQLRALVWFEVKKEENWPLSSSSAAYSAWTTGSRLAAYTSSFQP